MSAITITSSIIPALIVIFIMVPYRLRIQRNRQTPNWGITILFGVIIGIIAVAYNLSLVFYPIIPSIIIIPAAHTFRENIFLTLTALVVSFWVYGVEGEGITEEKSIEESVISEPEDNYPRSFLDYIRYKLFK